MQRCFVMMPFDPHHRPTYEKAIRPAVEDGGLECLREDEHRGIGEIVRDIRQHIQGASICVADLTGLNPNVVYETALAHAAGIPVILITQDDVKSLPFDIRNLRTIQFTASDEGYGQLRGALKETIQSVLASPETPLHYLEEMFVPSSLEPAVSVFVVAASPLSWRRAAHRTGGFRKLQGTMSDHLGIRGLIQAFGGIYGLDKLPDLVDPDDYDNRVIEEEAMNLFLVGSPKVNRWTGLLLDKFYEQWRPRLRFKAEADSPDLRNVRVMVEKDGSRYFPDVIYPPDDNRFKKDFGLLIRGPYPGRPRNMVLILAGRSSLGTEAACCAATHPKHVQELKERLSLYRVELADHSIPFYAVVAMERRGKPGVPDVYERANLRICDVHPFERVC